MKESQIQKKIIDKLTDNGWFVTKLIQTNRNGIPDLLCIRRGNVIFLEIKSDKGKVAPLQQYMIDLLGLHHVHARVVRSLEDIDVYCYKNL